MTQETLNKRRALIVRRWAAYRTGRAQREIWRRRRAVQTNDFADDAGAEDLSAELPVR